MANATLQAQKKALRASIMASRKLLSQETIQSQCARVLISTSHQSFMALYVDSRSGAYMSCSCLHARIQSERLDKLLSLDE